MVITSREFRRLFLEFFRKRNHEIIESSRVVPADDPTLLFTNAGMNQFKNIFIGIEKPEYTRAASVQKCIRVSGKHNDLEDVGRDGKHHTFFEMLGNWSFGDYYKREAIEWAWEFVTVNMGLPIENLLVSTYTDDSESYDIWSKVIKIDKERIVKLGDIEGGDEENFWSMGETGPCGPCSEIHYDYKPSRDRDFFHGSEAGEIIELWNLVFLEFDRKEDGSLISLPAKNVDTGLGLERALAILQGVSSNYDTDLFIPIMKKLEEISGFSCKNIEHLVSFQVIADHIRSLSFAISDGAIPSNEGRGYVLRRILRRAMRHGRLLGLNEPFLFRLVDTLVEIMGDPYHELLNKRKVIRDIVMNEEELFLKTLERGIEEFEKTAKRLKTEGKMVFPGKEAFILYDTYGFPIDLTEIMAGEVGLTIERNGFFTEMELQRVRAQKGLKIREDYEQGNWLIIKEGQKTVFTGYDYLEQEGMGLLKYKKSGKNLFLVFDKTPFYGEAGGQVGDTGYLEGDGVKIRVEDVKKSGDLYIHIGVIEQGQISNMPYRGIVDIARRKKIMANHTATHLLHHTLREVLGDHVFQSGSLVSPDRLRFDFNHYTPLTEEELDEVEDRVNEIIQKNLGLLFYKDVPIEQARSMGAMALFGEKYGKRVRVVEVPSVSMELCSGTHVEKTGDIGLFRVLRESSIASGVRRIEAITGAEALNMVKEKEKILKKVFNMLNTTSQEVLNKIADMQAKMGELEKMLKQERKKGLTYSFDLKKDVINAGKYKLALIKVVDFSMDDMRNASDRIKNRLKMGVIFIASVQDDRVGYVLSATEDAVKSGVHSGRLLTEALKAIGGRGGGRPTLAQGGGTKPEDVDKAFDRLKDLLKSM